MTNEREMIMIIEEYEKQLRFLIDLLYDDCQSLSNQLGDYDEMISDLSTGINPSEESFDELWESGRLQGVVDRSHYILNELKVVLGDKVRIKENNRISYEDVK